MDFIRNWQPDLLMVLIFIIGGIIEILAAPLFAKRAALWRWRIGGAFAIMVGLALLAIRLI